MVKYTLTIAVIFLLAACKNESNFKKAFGVDILPDMRILNERAYFEDDGSGAKVIYFAKIVVASNDVGNLANLLELHPSQGYDGILPECTSCGKWWDVPAPDVQVTSKNRFSDSEGSLSVAFIQRGNAVYLAAQGTKSLTPTVP